MDYSEYYSLIEPWQVYFDETWNRHYYFNPLNNSSAWELPEEIQSKVEHFYQKKFEREEEKAKNANFVNVPKQVTENPKFIKENVIKKSYLTRPARKQVEQSLATQFAYKQGFYYYLYTN